MAAANAPAELAIAKARHAQGMILLRALKAGTVRLEQVVIDGETWTVLDPAQVSIPANEPPREPTEEPREAPEG
jgi:hypothetical protein